jgi:hypothetical protein
VTKEQARASTGWPLDASPTLTTTEPPTDVELRVLRHLEASMATVNL